MLQATITANISQALTGIKKLRGEMKSLTTVDTVVRIRMDTSQVRPQMQRALSQLRSFQKASTSLNITANIASAMKNLQLVLDILRNIKKEASVTIHLKIDGDTIRGLSDIQKRLVQITGSGTNWGKHTSGIRNVGAAAKGATGALSRLKETLLAFGTGYLGIQVVQKIFDGIKSATIDYNATLQQSLVGLTGQLNGNRKAAEGLYATLQKLADTSSFRELDFLPNAQKFLAAKMSIQDVEAALRGIKEQTAGIGGDNNKLNQIATAINQIWIKPRLQLEELTTQLVEHGVPAFDLLATAYGTNTAQIQKWITDGLIPGKEAARALWNQMERQNFGAAEKQAKTFTGALSNLGDIANRALGGAFKNTFDLITDLLNKTVYLAQNKDFQRWAGDVGKWFQDGFNLATEAVKWLGESLLWLAVTVAPLAIGAMTSIGLRSLWLGRTAIASGAASGVKALAGLRTAFLATAASSLGMAGIVGAAIAAIVTDFGGLRSKLVDSWKWIARTFGDFYDTVMPDDGNGSYRKALEGLLTDTDNFAGDFKSSLQDKMKGLNLEAYLPKMPDMQKWFGDYDKWLKGAGGKIPDAYKPKLGTPDDSTKKATAALKLQKDALADAAQAWRNFASAIEKVSDRQIAAIEKMRDSLIGFTQSLEEKLLGVDARLMAPFYKFSGELQKLVGDRKLLENVFGSSRLQMAAAEGIAKGYDSRRETISGLDGNIPGKAGAVYSGNAISRERVLQLFRQGRDASTVDQICADVTSYAAQRLGFHLKKKLAWSPDLEAWAKKNLQRVPIKDAPAGSLVFEYSAPARSDTHTTMSIGGGYVASANRRRGISTYNATNRPQVRAYAPPELLADGNAGLQARANTTGKPQVSVRAPQLPPDYSALLAKANEPEYAQTYAKYRQSDLSDLIRLHPKPTENNSIRRDALIEIAGMTKGLHTIAGRSGKSGKDAEQFVKDARAIAYAMANYAEYVHNAAKAEEELKKTRDGITQGTTDYLAAQKQQAVVLAAGAPFLTAETFNLEAYQRAIDLTTEKLKIQGELRAELDSKNPVVAADAKKAFDERYAAAVKGYDDAKAHEKQKETVEKLNEEFKEMIRLRDENTKAAQESARAAADDLQAQSKALQTQRDLVALELKLRQNPKNTEADINRALAARAFLEEKITELQKSRLPVQLKLAAALALTKNFDNTEKLKQGLEDFKIGQTNQQSAIDAARRQLAGAQENLEVRRLEAAGQLSDLAKQELAWKYEDLQRARDKNQATLEELLIRKDIRDVLRETAQIDYAEITSSLDAQLAALRVPMGRDRDTFQRRQELSRNPNLNAGQIDGIISKEQTIRDIEEAQARMQQAAEGISQAFTGAFGTMATASGSFFDRLKAGAQSALESISQMLQDLAMQMLQNYLVSSIMGAFVGGGGAAGGGGTANINMDSFAGGAGRSGVSFGGFRAAGGPVVPNKAFVVGEKGPEVFIPKSAGNITSNEALATARSALDAQKMQRENAKIPSRSNGGGGNTTVINSSNTTHIGTVVANSPQELTRKIRENRGPSRGEIQREAAMLARTGAGRL